MGKPLMVMIAATAAAVVLATSAAEEVDSGTSDGGHTYSGKVLLVSMDGFRWDYIKSVAGLTSFSRLSDTGCSVDFVHPAFATKTFPCHYTIATGLHEESHGILANRMYDPVRNASFSKRSTESFWWEGGEPIWVTAERQNKRSAVYFWPGSDAEIRGYRPSQYLVYNQSVPFPQRVETALGWLEHGGKDLVLLYFHEPDKTGHLYGPSSTQVADKVREMDGILGLIMKTMEEKKLDDVNLILTSDHGMTDVNAQHRLLNLWDYLDRDTVAMVPDSGTVTAILPVEGREAQVLSDARKIPHVTVYRKDEIPERLHYKHNPRVMPIIILSDEGWILSSVRGTG
ncbi:ectonucleotide pyrophosphatase/phosphodiesterase family member 5-like [Babylonia areolata]|uniref:ectonucleotide pyrophosphatase/phosphodiesterase family member 5-like n=1 Tax=Babylonia areolata TaxID=304850 RepID=UPI003FD53404